MKILPLQNLPRTMSSRNNSPRKNSPRASPHPTSSVVLHVEHGPCCKRGSRTLTWDWFYVTEQPAPAPHLAHPEGCAAPRIVRVTVPRVSRSCEHFRIGFDLNLLQPSAMIHTGPQPGRVGCLIGVLGQGLALMSSHSPPGPP